MVATYWLILLGLAFFTAAADSFYKSYDALLFLDEEAYKRRGYLFILVGIINIIVALTN